MKKKYKFIKTPRVLYHLSDENHDGEIFTPRVPMSASYEEDMKKKRVCFSTSIAGCYKAIGIWGRYRPYGLYVHVPCDMGKVKVIKPTEDMVPDCKETREKWVVNPVKVKCIGRVKLYYHRYSFQCRWIERYE